MKRVVLLYNFEKSRLQAVRKSLLPLKVDVKTVSKKDFNQPVGYLVGIDGILPVKEKISSESFTDEMLVMYGFGSEMIDVLIAALKKGGVGKIDLKAVITPSNVYWDSVTLYKAIKADCEEMNQIGGKFGKRF